MISWQYLNNRVDSLLSSFNTVYVPLSHLRTKESQYIYITYSTGSGMLTRYAYALRVIKQQDTCNEMHVLKQAVHISR